MTVFTYIGRRVTTTCPFPVGLIIPIWPNPPFTPITAIIEIGSAIASFLLRRSVLVLVCILVALSSISRARHESRALLIETARRRRRSRERRREFFCFVCALFFFCIFWCVFCFFSEFFFVCEESLAGARDGGESRVSVFTHSRLHVMSHSNQNSNFSIFYVPIFSLPADGGFAIFLPGRGENEKRGGRRYLPLLGPSEVRP